MYIYIDAGEGWTNHGAIAALETTSPILMIIFELVTLFLPTVYKQNT